MAEKPMQGWDSDLSLRLLRLARGGPSRIAFLRRASRLVLKATRCDALVLELRHEHLDYRWTAGVGERAAFDFEILNKSTSGRNPVSRLCAVGAMAELFGQLRSDGEDLPKSPAHGPRGVRLAGDEAATGGTPNPLIAKAVADVLSAGFSAGAVFPLAGERERLGVMLLLTGAADALSETQMPRLEGLAQALGMAIVDRRAQCALRERVKELTCLYGIDRFVSQPGLTLRERLQGIVDLLPPAWQFPEIAAARIVFDDVCLIGGRFEETPLRQQAEIAVRGRVRGHVEVAYLAGRPEFVEGAFLKEEDSLIQAVARELGLLLERQEAGEDRLKLERQLRHSDRLATIGQLAAGVAHELNEPIGNILGYAQLLRRRGDIETDVLSDLAKIESASLHARDVVRKLLLFSRKGQPSTTRILDLNQVVANGLIFLEARCADERIDIVRSLAKAPVLIEADAAEIQQVLVNLVVNAIQAMPGGGTLTVETAVTADQATLTVQDTGIGMDEQTRVSIFDPFFTTKDVGAGTGLGLSVVHGIVTSCSGTIRVESAPQRGARFEVSFPRKRESAAN